MNRFAIFYILALLHLFTSCSGIKTIPKKTQNTDFHKYKTFSFLEWQTNSEQILSEADKNKIHEAISTEFESRQIQQIDKGGDLVISLYLVTSEETSTIAYTNYYKNFGGRYGGRFNNGWGGGYKATNYNKKDYSKGTFVLDVFDAKEGEQVWQAVSKSIVHEKPGKNNKTIKKAVKALMKKFPISDKD